MTTTTTATNTIALLALMQDVRDYQAAYDLLRKARQIIAKAPPSDNPAIRAAVGDAAQALQLGCDAMNRAAKDAYVAVKNS